MAEKDFENLHISGEEIEDAIKKEEKLEYIHVLNDDCLIHIFEYLSPRDRIIIERGISYKIIVFFFNGFILLKLSIIIFPFIFF